jgi:hypothetical protein
MWFFIIWLKPCDIIFCHQLKFIIELNRVVCELWSSWVQAGKKGFMTNPSQVLSWTKFNSTRFIFSPNFDGLNLTCICFQLCSGRSFWQHFPSWGMPSWLAVSSMFCCGRFHFMLSCGTVTWVVVVYWNLRHVIAGASWWSRNHGYRIESWGNYCLFLFNRSSLRWFIFNNILGFVRSSQGFIDSFMVL